MKKLVPHILIFLLLLNVWGMYGVFMGLQFQNEQEAIRRIDAAKYSEDELITIKIPMALPYASDNGEFERAEGSFEHNGIRYWLVEKKHVHDTLTVRCLEDKTYQRITNALATVAKTFKDQPADHSKNTFSFCKDYLRYDGSIIQSLADPWTSTIGPSWSNGMFSSVHFPVPTRPPEPRNMLSS